MFGLQNKFSKDTKEKLIAGAIKSGQIQKDRHKAKLLEYEKHPKICLHCHQSITYDKRRNSYCSRSCAVSVNNIGQSRNKKSKLFARKKCEQCGKSTSNPKYCSSKCFGKNKQLQTIKEIESGTYSVISSTRTLKDYAVSQRGHRCEKCNRTKWMKNPIALTIHHEDGDATNNRLDNVKLICWNCHSMTDNFGRKNNCSTRKYRYATSKSIRH